MRQTSKLAVIAVVLACLGALAGPHSNASAVSGPSMRAELTVSASVAKSDGLIAFVRAEQIYTITAAGSSQKQLTRGAKNDSPRWSPDGRRIAYIHEARGARDIWVMNADGSGTRQVTRSGHATAPSWSPDGRWLAFGTPLQKVRSSAPFGAPQLILGHYFADETLGYPLDVDTYVAWAPDGRHIAYYSPTYPDSPDHYVLVLDLQTGLVDEWDAIGGACCGAGSFADLTWGPQMTRLAYSEVVYEYGEPVPAPRVVMFAYPTHQGANWTSQAGDRQPEISPSGHQVVLMTARSGVATIVVTALNGTARHTLTRGYQPDWQPTG